MTKPEEHLVEEIRLNNKYAHLFYSKYTPDQYDSDSVPTIKKKTLFIRDYIQKVMGNELKNNIIPPNCRYIEKLNDGHLVIIEEPPAYRTIKTTVSMEDKLNKLKKENKLSQYGYDNWAKENRDRPYTFTLAFPYVIFFLYISNHNEAYDGQVYLRTQQMSGLSDYLLKMPTSNISDTGYICFGESAHGRHRSMLAAIQNAIMVWWSASFNEDYLFNYDDYKNVPILGNYFEWEYMSKINPMFIYSADWMKMDYNIGQRLESSKEHLRQISRRNMGYKELSRIFYSSADSGSAEKPSPRSKKTYPLFYDIAQGMYLDDKTNISVGDSIISKKGDPIYIDSFVGFSDGSDIKYIQIDIKGKKSLLKITSKSLEYLRTEILKTRRASQVTSANGVVIKPGDIIIVSQSGLDCYYKVDYIRKSRGSEGDILEVKAGNNYFISSQLNAKLFNIKEPEINGIKLNRKDEYIIISQLSEGAKSSGHKMKFDSVDVSASNTVRAKFINSIPILSRHSELVSLSTTSKSLIYTIDKVKQVKSQIVRCGRNIYYMCHSNGKLATECCWGVNGVFVYESKFTLKTARGGMTKSLLNDNKFFIEGSDFDIEFEIGDKVIVGDWTNPLDVLNVKVIQGFKYNESTGDISFILINKEEKLSEIKYIDGYYGIIHTGKIRKVTNKIGKLMAGTKIQANKQGIPCFPKKDVNIIISFIIDTGTEPMVLCSNGCTLWLSDVLNYFKKTSMKSKEWAKMDHAPLDLSKIKFQAGDLINGTKDYKNNYGYLLYGPSSTRSLRALPMEYFTGYPEAYAFDRYMIRECQFDCIPAPRVAQSKIEDTGILRGILNLHSFDVFENEIQTRYLNQRRG